MSASDDWSESVAAAITSTDYSNDLSFGATINHPQIPVNYLSRAVL